MKHSTVVDIGSSKVSCMTAGTAADGALVIRGVETRPYSGYRLGRLPAVASLSEALESAMTALRASTGLHPRSVCVGVPAPFVKTVIGRCDINIGARSGSGKVTDADLDFLFGSAADFTEPEGYSLMHSTPFDYMLDDRLCSRSPVGQTAQKLSASFCHALVDEQFASAVEAALDPLGIEVGSFVSGAMVSSAFTIPFGSRLHGAVLIDCGGTHCDVSAIRGNAVLRTESIGIGGNHFTNDIALGLRLPVSIAEGIKRRYVFGLEYGDSTELIRIPSEGMFEIGHSTVQMIIEARAEELASHLCAALDSLESELPSNPPVYMVGGGIASMRGGTEFLSNTTGRDIRLNMPVTSRFNTVNHAPVLALAQFMLYGGGANEAIAKQAGLVTRGGRILDNIKDFFTAANKR
ncbi:MAG: hypothetical protein J5544_04700 [Clostridia bacterium]|nr:hypothetical protein [Clostridia bacterium]